MGGETLLLVFLLGVLFLLYIVRTPCSAVNEGFLDTTTGKCDCYVERGNVHYADGMCWQKDFDGDYLRNPVFPCNNNANPKCECWQKHIQFYGGFCYDPGQRYGVRPPCTMAKKGSTTYSWSINDKKHGSAVGNN